MQLILDIEASQKDIILNILENLKDGLINKLKVLDSPYVSDEEQKEIESILNSRTIEDKEVSHSNTHYI